MNRTLSEAKARLLSDVMPAGASRTLRILPLYLLALPGIGCVMEAGEVGGDPSGPAETGTAGVGVSEEALTGFVTVSRNLAEARGDNDDEVTCSTSHISNANFSIYASRANGAMALGRRVAASNAFRACMKTGNESGIFIGAPFNATFGPYCIRGDTGCIATSGDGTDPYNNLMPASQHATLLTEMRRVQAMRLLALAQAPHDIAILCDANRDFNGGTDDFTDAVAIENTELGVREVVFHGDQGMVANATTTDADGAKAFLAGLYWHEAAHVHGYDHDDPGTVGHGGIALMGGCMDALVRRSLSVCTNTCAGGVADRVVTSLTSNTCECIGDPDSSPTFKSTTALGAGTLVVDSLGDAYRVSGSQIVKERGLSTTIVLSSTLGTSATQLIAGGDRLFVKTASGILRRNDGSDLTSVGFTNLGEGNALQVVADDLGNLYIRPSGNGSVKKMGLFSTTWTTIGGPSAKLIAGGSTVYSVSPNTSNIWKFSGTPNSWDQVGTAGSDFAVDSYGQLFALSPSKADVMRLTENGWGDIGNAAVDIIAGNRLYALNSLGEVWMWQLGSAGWWKVAGSSTSKVQAMDAGGDALWVRQGGSTTAWKRITIR